MSKIIKMVPIIFIIFIAVVGIAVLEYFSMQSSVKAQQDIIWGVDFSQSYAEYLGLDWKDAFSALIDDLGARDIKIHTQWDFVEGKMGEYYFDDLDWQVKKAEEKGAKIIFVIGMKTGRWPECHTPKWVGYFPENIQKAKLLKYVYEIVGRYKDSKAIAYWQVENEPFLKFGQCPAWYYRDSDLLESEIKLIKSLDLSREIIVSESGEKSMWFRAAKAGDVVGITIYRNAWNKLADTFSLNPYSFLNPSIYSNKAEAIKRIFGKKVICVELQSEPWASKPIMEASLDEQSRSMNPDMFRENIEFAKRTGFSKIFFWGPEWWYWMKKVHGQSQIWDEAKALFSEK